ncbi:precorrin-3B C(17)-methyltransferase [Butyrivibrio sp. MC2013]|uniref:precorrin-3B C(17)-methyltransferase n=1 Tax=Butyrivibrio sp. MC2013 TaxID=1280686 RepID=UPI00040F286A|nr:precorrin-3B C(17)-methyltransferase [Butyrivibrio sp. MC2013]
MANLYVIGMGPGSREDMTLRALDALKKSDLIIGYTAYIELLKKSLADDDIIMSKEYYSTGMTRETDRCRYALEKADSGVVTSLICSGDSGIYGMASPVLELAGDYPSARVEIIPGVTAASSGSALTGAPLSHDFAVISLSDRLTPWELIEKRIRLLAAADMPIAVYNPRSKGRPDYLAKMADILMEEGLPMDRPCALAIHVGREGQRSVITSLGELKAADVDMQTVVFIGSSATYVSTDKLITPRGYIK